MVAWVVDVTVSCLHFAINFLGALFPMAKNFVSVDAASFLASATAFLFFYAAEFVLHFAAVFWAASFYLSSLDFESSSASWFSSGY